jgi:biopolymer transport protein ExbD
MKFDRKTTTEAEIPTASMADIAFLLIIFFMVTTVFSATKGLELALPSDEKQDAPAEAEEAVFIHVYADQLLVDCKPMEPAGILPYLEPKLTRDAQKHVILYTDSEAPYKKMIEVYDALAEAKDIYDENTGENKNPWPFEVKNISIPTQSEVQDYIALFGQNPFETHCQQ